jgi:hypothetical protein
LKNKIIRLMSIPSQVCYVMYVCTRMMLPTADGCRIQYTRGCWAGEIVCRKNVRWRKTKEKGKKEANLMMSVGISRLGFFASDVMLLDKKNECE